MPSSLFPSGHDGVLWSLVTPYAEAHHNPWLYAVPVVVNIARITNPDGHRASGIVGGAFLGYLTARLTNASFPKRDWGVMFLGDGGAVYKKFCEPAISRG